MVLMARVDCALKLNNKLCDDFSVTHYPMLLWGPPSKFGSGWKPKQDKSDLILIDNGRTADRLLGWINKQLRSSYDLDDEKFENDYLMPSTSDPEQINNAEYDIEEATFTEHKMFCRGSRNNTRGFRHTIMFGHINKSDSTHPLDKPLSHDLSNFPRYDD
uniref:Uncharacterized protein n=1 Tax=Kalanchoe fedtschenkoi TaxID=63787 RepID=A0A7N0VG15_KALFE